MKVTRIYAGKNIDIPQEINENTGAMTNLSWSDS